MAIPPNAPALAPTNQSGSSAPAFPSPPNLPPPPVPQNTSPEDPKPGNPNFVGPTQIINKSPTTTYKPQQIYTAYKEVSDMQKELVQLNHDLAISGVIGILQNNEKLQPMMDKIIDNAKIKNKQSFLQRIQNLTMKATKQNPNVIDGKWGQNTDNAIVAACLISKAMLDFAYAVGAKLSSFSIDDVKSILRIIRSKVKSPETAAQLTTLLQKVDAATKEFGNILATSARQLSSGAQQTFNAAETELTQREQQFLLNHKDMVVPELKNLGITFGALSEGVGSLSQFLAQKATSEGQKLPEINQVINQIKQLVAQQGQR